MNLALIEARELNMDSRLFLPTPHRGINIDALSVVREDELPKQLINFQAQKPPSGEPASRPTLLRRLHFGFRKVSEKVKALSSSRTQKAAASSHEVLDEFACTEETVLVVTFDSACQGLENGSSMQADATTIRTATRFQRSSITMLRETIEKSLMSTVQSKSAFHHSERHGPVR